MEEHEKGKQALAVVWLILIQCTFIASIMLILVAIMVSSVWGDAPAPAHILLIIDVILYSYPVTVIASIIMGWITFTRKTYLHMFLWSILPFAWWLILFAVNWLA